MGEGLWRWRVGGCVYHKKSIVISEKDHIDLSNPKPLIPHQLTHSLSWRTLTVVGVFWYFSFAYCSKWRLFSLDYWSVQKLKLSFLFLFFWRKRWIRVGELHHNNYLLKNFYKFLNPYLCFLYFRLTKPVPFHTQTTPPHILVCRTCVLSVPT